MQADLFVIGVGGAFAAILALLFVARYFFGKHKLSTFALWGLRLTDGIEEEVKAVRSGLQPTIARVQADGIVTQLERQEVLEEIVRLVKVRFGVKALMFAKKASGAIGLDLDTWLARRIAPIAAAQNLLPPLPVLSTPPEVAKVIAGMQDLAKAATKRP